MLTWLESTTVARWLAESPSVWSLPTVLTLHTTGMAVLVGTSWLLDLRLLGIGRNVPLSAYRWVFPLLWAGLLFNLATGIMLFMKNATVWGTSLAFLVKMALVVAAVVTLMPVRSQVVHGAEHPPAGGSARLWALASILAWTGAVTAGRLLAYVLP